MTDLVRFIDHPPLHEPTLLLALEGWIDAGGAAQGAARAILGAHSSEPIAEFDSDGDRAIHVSEILNYNGPGASELKPVLLVIADRMYFGAGGEKIEAIPAVKIRTLLNPRGLGAPGTYKAKLTGHLSSDRGAGKRTFAAYARGIVTGSPAYSFANAPAYWTFENELTTDNGDTVFGALVGGTDERGNTIGGMTVGRITSIATDPSTRKFDAITIIPEATGQLNRAAGFGYLSLDLPPDLEGPATGIFTFGR